MTNSLDVKWAERLRFVRLCTTVVAVAGLLGICTSAGAFDVDTGNEDFKLNWNNTLRYTFGYRTSPQNQAFLKNINADDGNRNFKGIINNRIDLLSELTATYKEDFGVRFSGAGWYDAAYDGGLQNTSVATSNHFDSNGKQALGLSNVAERYYRGPNGELLDAFAFGKFEAAGVNTNIKVGRHSIYWGEGLLNPFNVISYGQNPLDLAKATAMPGVEVKELFRPSNQVSITVQPTRELTLAGQYFLQWEPNKLAEAGTFFGTSDVILDGGDHLLFAPGGAPGTYLRQGAPVNPRQARDFGVSARWNPEWLDGVLGVYYRNFSDKMPQVGINLGAGTYHMSYASDISVYGISLAKTVATIAYGAEFSYRTKMPLASSAAFVTSLPGAGDTFGARGETMHALVNAIKAVGVTPMWDMCVIMGEVDWNRWVAVTHNKALFNGTNPLYTAIDKPSRDNVGATVGVTPTWFKVFTGVDMSMPLTFSMGLVGNSAVNVASKNAGAWSAGLSFDIFQKYTADLKYSDYFGGYDKDASGAMTVANGAGAYKDRGFASFTLKTTF